MSSDSKITFKEEMLTPKSFSGAVYQPPQQNDVWAGMSDLSFSASQDTSNDYCKAQSMSSLKIVEDECNTALGMAINGCMSYRLQSVIL